VGTKNVVIRMEIVIMKKSKIVMRKVSRENRKEKVVVKFF
jgi:hypothetical protein